MKRWIIQVTSALSFFVFIAITTLCVRSYFRSDYLAFVIGKHAVVLESRAGEVGILLHNHSTDAIKRGWHTGRAGTHGPLTAFGSESTWMGVGYRRWALPAGNLPVPILRSSPNAFPKDVRQPVPIVLPGSDPFIEVTTEIAARAWYGVALSAILPLVWLKRRLSRRRFPPGHCQKCGYDLRASRERCPECGEPVAAPHVQAAGSS